MLRGSNRAVSGSRLSIHASLELPTVIHAGEVFFVPAETFHAARNPGSGNAAELATYVVEKGKPLIELAE